jgi:hypothetical protein
MPGDYLPHRDELLLAFTDNLRRIVSRDPGALAVAEVDAQRYALVQLDYARKLRAAVDPGTRGRQTVLLKDFSKRELVGLTRRLARQINNALIVSDAQRGELALTIRKTTPTPVPVPEVAPRIDVRAVDGRDVTIALRDVLRPTSKARPVGVAWANVFSFVGETPPDDVLAWTFEGGVSSPSKVTYTFDQAIEPGTRVWFAAMWVNRKGQSGPVSEPVSTVIRFGGVAKGSVGREGTRASADRQVA